MRNVYSPGSTSSPRPRRARTSARPWRIPRDPRQDGLPVRARPWYQRPAHVRSSEGTAGQRHNAPMAVFAVAKLQRLTERCLEAVHGREPRAWQVKVARRRPGGVVGMRLERRDDRPHPIVSGRARSISSSSSLLWVRYRPTALLSPGATGGFQRRTRFPLRASSAAACASAST